jgi:hypothetical protein
MVPLARSNKESCGEELGPTDGRNKPLSLGRFGWLTRTIDPRTWNSLDKPRYVRSHPPGAIRV